MRTKRRVAVMLDLQWPLKRHVAVFEGTQRYAAERDDWECVLDEFVADTLPSRRTRRALPYDGIIARATLKVAQRAAALRIPLVNVWAASPAKNLPTVMPDYAAAGRLCAEHLLNRGFHHFAVTAARDKADGMYSNAFVATVRGAGFECDSLVVPIGSFEKLAQWKRTQRGLQEWMDRWPTPIAVLSTDELAGRAIIQLCASRGLRIPIDMAMIAGTNDLPYCEHPPPALTSVEMGYDLVGYEAARWLDEMMSGRARGKQELLRLMPPVGLVPRESTDFFAVDDETVAAALRFIGENSRRPIDVNDVVKATYVSRPTLERRFRTHLGRSIGEEIRRLRIERAKRLLSDGDEPIKRIALAAGFANVATMNAAFRRELKLSPGKYRRLASLKRT